MDSDYDRIKHQGLDYRDKPENAIYKVIHLYGNNLSDKSLRPIDGPGPSDTHVVSQGNDSGSWQPATSSTEHTLLYFISLGVTLGVLDVFTILGNALVCVTVTSIRRLRTNTNFFIFSLALSDFLLGCLVLPFSILNTLFPESWPLGAVFCNLYVSTDVMLCTVSILNLFIISVDRYFAITRPLRYELDVTMNKVAGLIIGVWVFSALMAYVPIFLGWNTATGHVQNMEAPTLCIFEANALYVLLVSIGTYVVPLIIMCTVYSKVYAVAKRQAKAIQKMLVIATDKHSKNNLTHANGSSAGPSIAAQKATFTLASVVAAFAVCWVPYFVLFTARPFVEGEFNPHLDLFVLWLGYANSALNPFLYGFHSTEFRYGFMMVLCPQRARRHKQKHPSAQYL